MSRKLFDKSSLEKTGADRRGSTFKAAIAGKEYLFLEMRKGALRGGHYHDRETLHLVLLGRIKFEIADPLTAEQSEIVAKPMEIVVVKAGKAHLLEALEDSMFMEPLDKEKSTVDFEPQRARVKKFLDDSS
jgi:quercetin dioxygenase-like cupin family protein